MKLNDTWLLLMHQLLPQSDSFRVKMWRSILKTGAMQLKNSVYVLPSSRENRIKFEAVIKEVNSGQGDAFLCESKFIDGLTNHDVIEKFNDDRAKRFQVLAKELREVQKLLKPKVLSENDLMEIEHSIGKLERQMKELISIDFFECKESASTQKLLQNTLDQVNALHSGVLGKVKQKNVKEYQGRVWVTRQDIHVDRMASAWLISKFIDKKATFKFVADSNYKAKKNEVTFDMFNGEFTHVEDKCTFEVLGESFSLEDRAIHAIAEIIHDLDFKDTKFYRLETPGIQIVLQGITRSEKTDQARLEKAVQLFNELLVSLQSIHK